LTKINSTAAFAATMKSNPDQDDAMSSKSKSAGVDSAARKRAATLQSRRAHVLYATPGLWGQTVRIFDECNGEIGCRRIVRDDGSRSLPNNCDDCI
jgi:hypothetical protein